eukprot:TRINITY_DN818_c0_g1_i1.p1 TRINITY_DN818_c0_g1~~TRINITY_DN818_c0_g1_i1.p1  ORF type:complete len:318 (+),score=168.79 TRINITY_DN818_c0_g1_i1:78-1031(+)
MSILVCETDIQKIGQSLIDKNQPLVVRFRDVFTLKNLGGPQAVQALCAGFNDDSALLKHEIAYVLGQMQEPSSIPTLIDVLSNLNEDSMVRHEAGEALGAIATPELIPILQKFVSDTQPEVAETCILAIDRILWKQKQLEKNKNQNEIENKDQFSSVDPAPPSKKNYTISQLKQKLLDPNLSLFKRYRAMFTLRNIGTEQAIDALVEGFESSSALFRHEIAFVLGQLAHPHAIPALSKVLAKTGNEHAMVRHEAAEALGAIGNESCTPLLEKHAEINEVDRVVRESCLVALDIVEYVNDNERFQYADALQRTKETSN